MTATSPAIGAAEARPAPTIDLHRETSRPGDLLRAIWRSRALLAILARKDFQTRYRRTSLGMLWAVALPLLQTVVIVVVFQRLLHQRTHDYPVFVLSGMVLWSYFSSTLQASSTAIVDASDMSSRVYFPRALLPMTPAVANGYSFLVGLAILLVACPFYHVSFGPRLWLLLPGIAATALLTTSFGLVAAALHVYFRDIRYVVGAMLLVWFYVTPIIYQQTALHGLLRTAVSLNPVTGVIDLFRAATIGVPGGLLVPLATSAAWAVALFVVALVLHARHDRIFADLL